MIGDLKPAVVIGLLELADRRPDATAQRDPATLTPLPSLEDAVPPMCPVCLESYLTISDDVVCRQCRYERGV